VDDWNTTNTNSTFDGMSGKPDEVPKATDPNFNTPLEETLLPRYNDDILKMTGIPKTQFDEICKVPKYSRPEPSTYLNNEYIINHTAKFNNGVTKISYKAPSGYAGPPGGTFVMPSSIADDLISKSDGSIAKLEKLLGLEPGSLGSNPVRIDIANPSGLRMPSGNEKGANLNWIPGGYTLGGIPEMIIDSPAPGQYIINSIT
jgi:hypothetical protein